MEVYNKDLYYILNNIDVLKPIKGAKLVIALNRAITSVKEEVRLLETVIEHSEEYKQYEKELNELKVKHSKKDKNKQPIIKYDNINGIKQSVYDISDIKAFNKDIEVLNAKYEKEIKLQNKAKEEYIDILSKPSEFKRTKFKESELPEDINYEQIDIISLLLDY